jgi:ubiquinone/menaquinone biosynthesis C-methylase UbiE
MDQKTWVQSFFVGKNNIYEQAYEETLDSKRTGEEIEQILNLLPMRQSECYHILDWCGGWGRHAIELAKRGHEVTVLDISEEYLKRAKREAKKAGVGKRIKTICADFRETPSSIQADYAINMFTAGIGYLSEEDDLRALKSLYGALKYGTTFLLDTMSLFWIVKNFQEKGWNFSSNNKKLFLEKREFDFWTGRIQSKFIFHDRAKKIEQEISINHRIYTPIELIDLLKRAGFIPIALYGGLDGSAFDFNSKRIVIMSRRY